MGWCRDCKEDVKNTEKVCNFWCESCFRKYPMKEQVFKFFDYAASAGDLDGATDAVMDEEDFELLRKIVKGEKLT